MSPTVVPNSGTAISEAPSPDSWSSTTSAIALFPPSFRQACAAHRTTGNSFLHGDSLNSLGYALYAAGRIDQALIAFQE